MGIEKLAVEECLRIARRAVLFSSPQAERGGSWTRQDPSCQRSSDAIFRSSVPAVRFLAGRGEIQSAAAAGLRGRAAVCRRGGRASIIDILLYCIRMAQYGSSYLWEYQPFCTEYKERQIDNIAGGIIGRLQMGQVGGASDLIHLHSAPHRAYPLCQPTGSPFLQSDPARADKTQRRSACVSRSTP